MTTFHTLLKILLTSAVIVLFACKSESSSSFAASDGISLSYTGASATIFSFTLQNRSAQPIYILATKTHEDDVIPWKTTLVCTSGKDPSYSEAINAPPLGYGDKSDRVSVARGSNLRLRLNKEDVPTRFEGRAMSPSIAAGKWGTD
jgi:hypothetical protein